MLIGKPRGFGFMGKAVEGNTVVEEFAGLRFAGGAVVVGNDVVGFAVEGGAIAGAVGVAKPKSFGSVIGGELPPEYASAALPLRSGGASNAFCCKRTVCLSADSLSLNPAMLRLREC